MKINELQQLSKTLINTADSFFRNRESSNYAVRKTSLNMLREKLNTLGWCEVDSGAYAMVFSHPKKKYVIKLTSNPDEGYAEYVYLLKQHPNEHFPVISDLKSMKIGKYIYTIYLIEKLVPINRMFNGDLPSWFYSIMNYPNESLEKRFNDSIPEIFIKHPDLVEALRLLGREVKKFPHLCLDMHMGNMMQRLNGTIVITDPYA